MTKYIDLRENKIPLEGVTRFDDALYSDYDKGIATFYPDDFKNVALICVDRVYGAVFKAWHDDENGCNIYFGHAGAEFNQ